MLFDDYEDTVDKTPSVRPNDVLDIEISPIITAKNTSWLQGFDKKKNKQKSPSNKTITKRQRRTKRSKNTVVILNQETGGMKRGDPFLPSVMADENPIALAEYSAKKTIPKKPSDCKCKGMGYNCSPSAVLPEEMRQQWGCGMFGKATPSVRPGSCSSTESNVIARPIAPCGTLVENSVSMPRTTFCGNNCNFTVSSNTVPLSRPPTICWECKTYPCLCFSTGPKPEASSFLPTESEDRRKKVIGKGSCFKGKANKTRLLINTSTSQPTVKRITCFNKENNIISTSNFSKDNASHFSSSTSDDAGFFYESKYNPATFKSTIKSRADNYRNKVYLTNPDFPTTTSRILSDDNAYTSLPRYRHRVRSSRRSATSIPSSAITTANGPYGDARMFEPPHQRLPYTSKQQMYMGEQQVCYCERCERRVQLLSKMEALGFPSSTTHPKPAPYLHQPHQRYNPTCMPQFPTTSSSRYMPYTAPYSYTYPNIPPDTGSFNSPEINSPINDDTMINNGGDNMFPSLLSQSTPIDPFSYLDTDQMLDSPVSSNGAIVDDLLDLSVKDTVDFFMALKSPLADTLPLSSDNAETDVESDAFGCNVDDGPFSLGPGSALPADLQSDSTNESSNPFLPNLSPQGQRFGSSGFGDMQSGPMSQIYSSLISDLEDELKCAIENIPIE